MKTTIHKPRQFYSFCCTFVTYLSLFFTVLLFVSGFLFTCYATDMTSQQVLTRVDDPIANLLGIAAAGFFSGAVLYLLLRIFKGDRKRVKKTLLIAVTGWIILFGAVLVFLGRTAPAADAWSVYSAACSMAAGDTSVIDPTASYLSYYPQQVGLMAFFEILIRLWNLLPTSLQAYHFIKLVYVALTCVIVFFQYKTVHLLFHSDRADCIYLLLAAMNLPLVMYSSFVYGEIPSYAALSVGFYCLAKIFCPSEDPAGTQGAGILTACVASFALAMLLRKNSLIILIAVILVCFMESVKRKQKRLFAMTACILICTCTVLPAMQKICELRAGNYLSSGVPAMSYFAMGTQESSRGNGWYNGYNFNTYQDSEMDAEATIETSRLFLRERLTYFKNHPDYAAWFYWNKYLSQWADGTYASRQATLATFGGRKPFVESFYSGPNSVFYIGICNIYQNLLYLGSLLFAVYAAINRRDRSGENALSLIHWLFMIAVFGGFLFHLIWEANGRYIFPYGLLLMPYAASGLGQVSSALTAKISGRRTLSQ